MVQHVKLKAIEREKSIFKQVDNFILQIVYYFMRSGRELMQKTNGGLFQVTAVGSNS